LATCDALQPYYVLLLLPLPPLLLLQDSLGC
jgi:hypothetical protein